MSSVYEIITDRICEILEKGEIPWHKPWTCKPGTMHQNAKGREYNGLNIIMLNCMAATMNYKSNQWITYKQAGERGWQVRKGEKGTPVIYWNWVNTEKEDKTGKKVTDSIPFLRYYTVFNFDQVEGAPAPAPEEEPGTIEPIVICENIVNRMPNKPAIKQSGTGAFYSPDLDFVNMPMAEWDKAEEYYSTLFHELIHSTGHVSRLGRFKDEGRVHFGSDKYSKEELIAELGAAFLCGNTGIEQTTIENSAAYIQSWLKALKNDKRMIVFAAAAAQKAADYILDKKNQETESA